MYKDKLLQASRTLQYYDIKCGDTLLAVPSGSFPEPEHDRVVSIPVYSNEDLGPSATYPFDEDHDWIYVRYPTPSLDSVDDVFDYTPVKTILKLIGRDKWDLTFNGVILIPSMTLGFYGIQCGDTLQAISKVKPKLPPPEEITKPIQPNNLQVGRLAELRRALQQTKSRRFNSMLRPK